MKYTAQLTVTGDVKLYDYLIGECRDQPRSTMRIEHDGTAIVVTMNAKDAVALRSCFNTLGQALSVWEKTP